MIGPRPSRALALPAVADGRVSAVGPDDEILALVGPGTERVDLDRAPLSAEPEALRDATVWLTMVGGEIVWRREEG